jgi:hypothetical protein
VLVHGDPRAGTAVIQADGHWLWPEGTPLP